ncbi:hypothetical protein K3495_g10005 [Podosphaera aphanis]|nr:hypothetical protein K3495_g10005 [Podosphaera aphanis]
MSSVVDKFTKLSLSELLESTTPHPGIYLKAMLELKRLSDQPICHRMAAHLLMDNCKNLNEIDEQNYYSSRGKLQQDQVDAFAATLTMCDMERANFDVPGSCLPFTSSSLIRAAEINGKFKFSSQEVNNCLRGLGKNSKHWATWLSYRDSALLFCRAARINVEKGSKPASRNYPYSELTMNIDETIALYQKLTVIMEEFTSDLHQDLRNLKANVEGNTNTIDSMFKNVKVEVDDWKTTLSNLFTEISDNINGVNSEIRDLLKDGNQARSGIENFFSEIIKGNVKLTAEYQRGIDFITNKYHQRLEDLNESLSYSELHATSLRANLLGVQKWMVQLQQRQNSTEKQAQLFSDLLVNVTTLLHGHNFELERANSAISGIQNDIEKMTQATLSHYQSSKSGFAWDLSVITISILVALLAGNYGLTPTLTGNAILILGGFFIGNLTVIHWEFLAAVKDWILHYLTESRTSNTSNIGFHQYFDTQRSDIYFQNETYKNTINADVTQRLDQGRL